MKDTDRHGLIALALDLEARAARAEVQGQALTAHSCRVAAGHLRLAYAEIAMLESHRK